MIEPNIIPTRGTNITFLTLILDRIVKNIKDPIRANMKANRALPKIPALGINSIENNTPILAESIVPAVVGDVNLFLVICCMIKPLMLSPAPAMIILITLGILLMKIIFILSKLPLTMSDRVMVEVPINRETSDNNIIPINKYFFSLKHSFVY